MPDKDSKDKEKKSLSPEDEALWREVKRTVKEPLRRQNRHAKAGDDTINPPKPATPSRADFATLLAESTNGKPSKTKKQGKKASVALSRSQKKLKTPAPSRLENFSQKEVRNLSGGKQAIEGIIDLHGHTQKTAESALKNFLHRAREDGKRYVLVITGKGGYSQKDQPFEGGAPEPGVLKRRVPQWLDEMTDMVLSYKTAHKKHGGEGALYVRLRKSK